MREQFGHTTSRAPTTYALTNASPPIRPSEAKQEPTDTEVTNEASEAAPAQATQEAPEAAEREAHIQGLLSKISQNPDFPSLRDSIRKIQKLARCETAHLRSFAEEIIQDVALSNKILRLINTAFYRSVGGGTIDSLSRAISLMEFQSVGMLAASLKLFDNLPQDDSAQRVIVCLRDKRTHTLMGRVGLGDSGQAMANFFKIPVNPPSDLFGLLCAKSADALISDCSDKAIVSGLPEWYTTHVNAPTFLVLPLNMGVFTNGMIYADHATPNSLAIDDQVLKRLKTLRNQLVMAIHMRGLE